MLVKLEVSLPLSQGLAETMSETPGNLTSLAEKLGRFGLQDLMTLPPSKGGTKKNNLLLLPRMQGAAGDYVFDELSREE